MTHEQVEVRCRKCLERGESSPNLLAVVALRTGSEPLVTLAGKRTGNRDLARQFQSDGRSEATYAEALAPGRTRSSGRPRGMPYSAAVGSARLRTLPVRGGDVQMPWTRTGWVLVAGGNHPVSCPRGHRTQLGVGRLGRRALDASASGLATIYE